MNSFWNQRFEVEEYVYGTEPNRFFKEQLDKLSPGKLLLPGEGEGRNAVYAAKTGWHVTAFDSSTAGKSKAENLAKNNGVNIHYQIADYESAEYGPNEFDVTGLIFAHMHPEKRREIHRKLTAFLKPGGMLILEGFSKKQIHNNSGGPKNVEMLFSKEELQNDFVHFSKLEITENEIVLDEGTFHQGTASVIRVVGIR